MSVDSMPAVPNEAFGVFLSSSPPAINALAGYCVLWEGAGLRLPPSRRASRGGHIVSRHVRGPATISGTSQQHSDDDSYAAATSYLASAATDDLSRRGRDNVFIERSSPIPCDERLQKASKPKKRVTFADNLGFDLEAVKVICEEPGTQPPELCIPAASTFSPPSPSIAVATEESAVQKSVEAAVVRQPCFRVDFPQPVSNYAVFKARLVAQCVAVENVTVESVPTAAAAAARVTVTVKVRNLAFEKRVFLRATRNGWKSHRDFDATFFGSSPGCSDGPQSPSECAYDTFLLRADLAGALQAAGFLSPIEFAVCYRAASGPECWDNNGGSNYRLVADYSNSSGMPEVVSGGSGLLQRLLLQQQQAAEPAEQASDRWTAYAAWRTTGSGGDVPYW